MKPALAALLLVAALAGCREEAVPRPDPVAMTEEAIGHFCQMNLLEHPGPKAQVHLEGMPGTPLFFSQVRDAVAFRLLPEQQGEITAIYVSDMAKAPWADPGATNWIAAEDGDAAKLRSTVWAVLLRGRYHSKTLEPSVTEDRVARKGDTEDLRRVLPNGMSRFRRTAASPGL